MAKNIYFVVETALSDDGKKLEALTPDENGWYNGIPMAVLGIPTRNNTQYDDETLIDAINDPDTTFNQRLRDGELFGENGHPFIYKPLSDPESSVRIFRLDPDKKACNYKKFYCKNDPDLNLDIIYSDLKPMGPYGKYAEEQLLDPNINFSTSLRAVSSQEKRNNILFRRVINLITFDVSVPGGGFKQASKRYHDASLENFCEILNHDVLENIADHANYLSMEGLLTNTELNDIFKHTKINISTNLTCYKIDKDVIHINEEKQNHSIAYLTSKLV